MSSSIWSFQVLSWSFLRCRSCLVSHCLGWPLFGTHAPSSRVKPGKARQIAANEKAGSAHFGSGKIGERLAFLSYWGTISAGQRERPAAHGARKAWLVELIWSSNVGGAQWCRIRRASRTRTVTLRSCGRRRGCGLPCQTTRAVASPARCAGEANPSDAYADKRGR